MNYNQYEEACQKRLKKKFKNANIEITSKTGKRGGDNGVDIRVEFANGSLMYAQCKHYYPNWEGENKVDYIGIDKIRAFKWCMERDRIQTGYYFSNIKFSKPAEFIAKINGIKPIYFHPDSEKIKI